MLAPEGYLTPEQAGARLGVSGKTVRRMVRNGELRAVLPRGHVKGMLVPEDEIAKFCAGFSAVSPSWPR